MKAVVLVGGKGTRLRPLTFRTPKPLIPLVNRASLEFTLDACVAAGVEEVILSTSYLPRHFEERFPGNTFRGTRLVYVHEEHPLDTAGAVKNAETHLDDTFLVFNGDVLSGLSVADIVAYHRAKNAVATLYLKAVADPRAFGLVPIGPDGRVLEFLEKPETDDEITTDLINAGCYVLEPSVLELVPPATPFSFERGLFPALLDAGDPVYGYPSTAYWLDIGTPGAYLQAHADLLAGALPWTPPGVEIAPRVWVEDRAEVDPTAKLEGPVVMADGVRVGPRAHLEGPVTIGADATIAEGARVVGSVIHARARIGPGCEVDGSIVGEEAVLHDRVVVAEAAVVGPGADIEADNELRRGIRVWPDVEVPEGSIRF